MPNDVQCIDGKLWSKEWGLPDSHTFADKWQRLRASGKEMGLSRDAQKRLEWFCWYYAKGGCNAVMTCRHFGIARKLFYYWRKRFKEEHLPGLEERSRRPHRVRESTLTPTQELRIRVLRKEFMHYSKMKLRVLYRERHGEEISSWKIQRVIQQYQLYPNPQRAANMAKKRKQALIKKRITDLVKEPHAGFLFCIDTVVTVVQGHRRYILTAIDSHSRYAYARMYTSQSSYVAADFLHRLHGLVEGKIIHVQTDNGSEFKKYFEEAIADLKLQHWWSRAHRPKDNAVLERFNRTIQEEFVRRGNGYSDTQIFNCKLIGWLIEYDYHRPHAALGYRRPIELASLDVEESLSRLRSAAR